MVTVAVPPTDAELLQAFRLVDARLTDATDRGPLLALRNRLAGEMLGDADRVGATLADEFELVTYAGGKKTVTGRTALVDIIRRQGRTAGGIIVWTEFHDLVIDECAIAAQGVVHMLFTGAVAKARGHDLHHDELCWTSGPLALFLRFDDALMTTEIIYMDTSSTEATLLPGGAMPSVERLRALVEDC